EGNWLRRLFPWDPPVRNLSCRRRAPRCGKPARRPGQTREEAFVVTMDTRRWGGAQPTRRRGPGRVPHEGDLCRAIIDMTRLEAQPRDIREQAGKGGGGWCRAGSERLLNYPST